MSKSGQKNILYVYISSLVSFRPGLCGMYQINRNHIRYHLQKSNIIVPFSLKVYNLLIFSDIPNFFLLKSIHMNIIY